MKGQAGAIVGRRLARVGRYRVVVTAVDDHYGDFEIRQYMLPPEWECVVDARVKWDGCFDWKTIGYAHGCDGRDTYRFGEALAAGYTMCARLIPRWWAP